MSPPRPYRYGILEKVKARCSTDHDVEAVTELITELNEWDEEQEQERQKEDQRKQQQEEERERRRREEAQERRREEEEERREQERERREEQRRREEEERQLAKANAGPWWTLRPTVRAAAGSGV